MARANSKDRQDAILAFIKQEVQQRGYPPSVREIGDAIGITSTSTVHGHLARLEGRGLIRRDPTKPRAIEIIDDDFRMAQSPLVPLVGKVTAGIPITALENIEDYLTWPPYASDHDHLFALRVSGDSMIDAGIIDGDIVYVRRQSTADNGEIIVAMTEDDEATVKRFYREKDHVRLQPENKTMQPLRLKQITVLGVVIGLWRSIT